jgi:hypothetical protein
MLKAPLKEMISMGNSTYTVLDENIIVHQHHLPQVSLKDGDINFFEKA